MAVKYSDKILCGAALLILLTSLGWNFSQGDKLAALRRAPHGSGEASTYVPAALNELQVNTQTWSSPGAQTRGPEWVYDVFTPPEIYYDAISKQFSVTPPSGVAVVVAAEPPFGVSLVQVKQDDFRLQLVGYTGSEGNFSGTFENTITGKTVIGRSGKKITDLDLTIRNFDVKRIRTKQEKGMELIHTEATAEVVDDKTGEVYNLTNQSRLTKGTPIALLKVDGAAEPITCKAGAKFTAGDASYTVTSVSAEPAEVVVVKESPALKEPVTKTLNLAAPVSAAPVATPLPAAKAPASSASPFGL